MERITKADLRRQAEYMSRATGRDFTIGYAYGRPRLYADAESREVSPRLSPGELSRWMHAYMDGYHHGQEVGFQRASA